MSNGASNVLALVFRFLTEQWMSSLGFSISVALKNPSSSMFCLSWSLMRKFSLCLIFRRWGVTLFQAANRLFLFLIDRSSFNLSLYFRYCSINSMLEDEWWLTRRLSMTSTVEKEMVYEYERRQTRKPSIFRSQLRIGLLAAYSIS